MKEIAREYGIDFSHPVGFSSYLMAIFGPHAPPDALSLRRAFTRGEFGTYKSSMKAYFDVLAPKGVMAFRGLAGVRLPGPTEVSAFFAHYARDQERRYGSKVTDESYSMNVAYDIPNFVQPGRRIRGGDGRDSVLIFGKAKLDDIISFGGDSESGDAMEAEIYLKPSFAHRNRVLVLSSRDFGDPINASLRRDLCLDEHLLVTIRQEDSTFKLFIHPDTPKELYRGAKVKAVSTKVSGLRWTEVNMKAQARELSSAPERKTVGRGKKPRPITDFAGCSATFKNLGNGKTEVRLSCDTPSKLTSLNKEIARRRIV